MKGAEATGRAIHKGAAKIREHMAPEETPSEVSPRVTKGLQAAKQATGGAVRVSQFLGENLNIVVRSTQKSYLSKRKDTVFKNYFGKSDCFYKVNFLAPNL